MHGFSSLGYTVVVCKSLYNVEQDIVLLYRLVVFIRSLQNGGHNNTHAGKRIQTATPPQTRMYKCVMRLGLFGLIIIIINS